MSLGMTPLRCFFNFNEVITQVTTAHMNRRQSASICNIVTLRKLVAASPRVAARTILLPIIGLEAGERRLGVCPGTALAYKYNATRPLL